MATILDSLELDAAKNTAAALTAVKLSAWTWLKHSFASTALLQLITSPEMYLLAAPQSFIFQQARTRAHARTLPLPH